MSLDDILSFDKPTKSEIKPKKIVKKRSRKVVVDERTSTYFTDAFKQSYRVKSADMDMYSNKKTIYGTDISVNDKLVTVSVINAKDALNAKFISISFKNVAKSELKQFLKDYTLVNVKRSGPTVVERCYMEHVEFMGHKQRIHEQFL